MVTQSGGYRGGICKSLTSLQVAASKLAIGQAVLFAIAALAAAIHLAERRGMKLQEPAQA